jgi:hypothetical protein
MRNFLVFASLILLAGAAEACVGFTGAYSTFRAAGGNYHVMVLEQNDCKTIAMGSFQLDVNTSAVSYEVEPKVSYVDKDNMNRCEMPGCRVFTMTAKGLEFAENASVYLGDATCRYDRVSWARQDIWDLKITYRITDTSAACRKYRGSASVVMKDIKHSKSIFQISEFSE